MIETTEAAALRQAAIMQAALGVFLRYGYKKTSMDDVARAAGLSRQGLYLHFRTKEALFRAVVTHSIESMQSTARDALAREDLDVQERLLGAFDALHGMAAGSENLDELFITAVELVGPIVCTFEEPLVNDIARVLRAAGIAARWKDAGITAKDLVEHLVAASTGIKTKVKTPAEYRDRMQIAVRIVCLGAAR
jgi:AcrR family transcriptional regulator